MDKFLEKYNLLKLNELKTESLNRPIRDDEIKAVITKLLVHKSRGMDSFTGEFYKTFKEDLTPILLRLFQKIQEDRRLPNSLYEASIILIPKPDKDTTMKLNYRPITHDEIQTVLKKLPTHKSPGPDGFTEEFTKHLREC